MMMKHHSSKGRLLKAGLKVSRILRGAGINSADCGILSFLAFGRQVWNNLHKMAEQFPVEGNMGGSYLTMFSKGGFIFGIINIIGNFGTVFVDQARVPSFLFL